MGRQSRRASAGTSRAREEAHGFRCARAASERASFTCDFTQPLNPIIVASTNTNIRIVQFLPLVDV